jgi:hypothetical protein
MIMKLKLSFTERKICYFRFQTPATRFQEPRRDVRSGNNNIRGKKAPPNAPDNKQKQHDNKRVNNQQNNGVS